MCVCFFSCILSASTGQQDLRRDYIYIYNEEITSFALLQLLYNQSSPFWSPKISLQKYNVMFLAISAHGQIYLEKDIFFIPDKKAM